jgi:effector-binding domain-containing protein
MNIALAQRAEQPYVSIRTRANFTEWGTVNALVPEVLDWLGQRGQAPAGPPFYRYHEIGGMAERFDVEVGFPVAAPVKGDDRVRAGSLPAGRYVLAEHHGHPDSIAASHMALVDWATEQGIALTGSPDRKRWEVMLETYATDPATEPDPANWITELAYLTR